MHKMPIAAAAVLAVMTVAASAQTTSPSTPRPAMPGTAPAPVQHALAINPLTKDDVSNIEGATVYGGGDAKLGYVSTVLMDPQTKKIDRLVVKAGGVLGVGGRRVAIPIDQFKWDAGKGGFRLPMTMASLKSMPEWVEGAETATGSSQPPKTEKPLTGAGDDDKMSK
ncbi:MAG: PRC-barrel domain-containing protein [Stellaceae bacterium]